MISGIPMMPYKNYDHKVELELNFMDFSVGKFDHLWSFSFVWAENERKYDIIPLIYLIHTKETVCLSLVCT